MSQVVRKCRIEDLPVLVELCAAHASYEGASYNATDKIEKLRLAIFSDVPVLYCLVVEEQNKVVGYCAYTFDYSTWEAKPFLHMDCLYIEDSYRGKGIGLALLGHLRTIALEKGCINIQWQTPIDNEGGIRFYSRLGASPKKKCRFTLALG